MYRIYYDQEGNIIQKVDSKFAVDQGLWIDVEQNIKIDHFKVDVETATLQAQTPSARPRGR